MLFNRNSPQTEEVKDEHSFPAPRISVSELCQKKFAAFIGEYSILFEAAFVAVSAHILAFPLIWFIGWALPWPKSPVITTVIELDLSNWPEEAVPREIKEIFESEKHGKK